MPPGLEVVPGRECLFRPPPCPAGRTHHPRFWYRPVNVLSRGFRPHRRPERESLERLAALRASALPLPQCPPCREVQEVLLQPYPPNPCGDWLSGQSWPDQWGCKLVPLREMATTSRERQLIRTTLLRGQPGACSPHPGTAPSSIRQSRPSVRPAATGLLPLTPTHLVNRPSPSTPERGEWIGFHWIQAHWTSAHWDRAGGFAMASQAQPRPASIKVVQAGVRAPRGSPSQTTRRWALSSVLSRLIAITYWTTAVKRSASIWLTSRPHPSDRRPAVEASNLPNQCLLASAFAARFQPLRGLPLAWAWNTAGVSSGKGHPPGLNNAPRPGLPRLERRACRKLAPRPQEHRNQQHRPCTGALNQGWSQAAVPSSQQATPPDQQRHTGTGAEGGRSPRQPPSH